MFDLTTNEFDEIFQPPPPVLLFQVDKIELAMAVKKTKQELLNVIGVELNGEGNRNT